MPSSSSAYLSFSLLSLEPSSSELCPKSESNESAPLSSSSEDLEINGFNAKSLTFGMNGMSVSNSFWTAGEGVTNHWGFDSKPKDLPTVSN